MHSPEIAFSWNVILISRSIRLRLMPIYLKHLGRKENIFDWFKWFEKSIKININLPEGYLKVIDAVSRRTQHEITILNCKTSFTIDIHVTPTSFHICFHRAKCCYLLKIQRSSLSLLGFTDNLQNIVTCFWIFLK